MPINKEYGPVINWLYVIAAMVFIMVLIGGITRLTDAGLSMVDWKPIMGIIPPLTEAEWQAAFTKYKAFPEFKLINFDMDLAGFKSIFFWEYFHRLFGRLIGMVFLLPYMFFLLKKRLPNYLHKNFILLFVMGGLQGLMGWYMVKSGLVNRPDVSQYRLAAHLGLAFVIIAYTLWTILRIKYPRRNLCLKSGKYRGIISIFAIVLGLQIFYGALVAGLDAGLTHNTFPKMGRFWIPDIINLSGFFGLEIFENTVYVQFIHRALAWLLVVLGLLIHLKSKISDQFLQKRSMQYVTIGLFVQFTLGVITLLALVPVSIASMHQVGACALLLLTVRMFFFTFTTDKLIKSC